MAELGATIIKRIIAISGITCIVIAVAFLLVYIAFRAKDHSGLPMPNGERASANGTADGKYSVRPTVGFVPNEETAIRIAEAVWIPIYGGKKIEKEKPFKATLHDTVWIVTGTLPKGSAGGTAIAEISKESGCIIRVSHEK